MDRDYISKINYLDQSQSSSGGIHEAAISKQEVRIFFSVCFASHLVHAFLSEAVIGASKIIGDCIGSKANLRSLES